jgi:hypothetical protein
MQAMQVLQITKCKWNCACQEIAKYSEESQHLDVGKLIWHRSCQIIVLEIQYRQSQKLSQRRWNRSHEVVVIETQLSTHHMGGNGFGQAIVKQIKPL